MIAACRRAAPLAFRAVGHAAFLAMVLDYPWLIGTLTGSQADFASPLRALCEQIVWVFAFVCILALAAYDGVVDGPAWYALATVGTEELDSIRERYAEMPAGTASRRWLLSQRFSLVLRLISKRRHEAEASGDAR